MIVGSRFCMDFVSHVLRRIFPNMDIDSLRVRIIWNTIGLHTTSLGLIPGNWEYRAT